MRRALLLLILLLILLLAGCEGGAVMFAPTPAPPDTAPLRYEHSGGIFSALIPPGWVVYDQNTTALAAAFFSLPGTHDPALTVAVMNLGRTLDAPGLAALLDDYQARLRPDAAHYVEQDRRAMGDGSWRMTGVRTLPGGTPLPLNTFIAQTGTLLTVIEAAIPPEPARQAALQTAVNSVRVSPEAALEVADTSVLAAAALPLEITRLHAWTTAAGVLFITGEAANRGAEAATDLPVRAVLYTSDGTAAAEAVDTVMGRALVPGGFAPFSLRFGQGQPPGAVRFTLALGGADWQPQPADVVYGPEQLDWIDESRFDDAGRLLISGVVTNVGAEPVGGLRAVAAVFDSADNVIAAGFSDLTAARLGPNESAPFEIVIPEMGGDPALYTVTVQGTRADGDAP
jgi:hypothetical protein